MQNQKITFNTNGANAVSRPAYGQNVYTNPTQNINYSSSKVAPAPYQVSQYGNTTQNYQMISQNVESRPVNYQTITAQQPEVQRRYTEIRQPIVGSGYNQTSVYQQEQIVQRPVYQPLRSNPGIIEKKQGPLADPSMEKNKCCGSFCWALWGLLGLALLVLGLLFGLGVIGPFDGPNINIPWLNLNAPNATLPNVDINGPNVNLPNVDINGPNVNLPNVDLNGPNVNLPNVGLNGPNVNLPNGTITAPNVNLPSVDVNGPNVNLPNVDVNGPNVNLPNGTITAPNVNLPSVDVNGPNVNLPSVDVNGPNVNLPSVDVNGPNVNLPNGTITAPDVNLPGTDVTVPPITLPNVNVNGGVESNGTISGSTANAFGSSEYVIVEQQIISDISNSTAEQTHPNTTFMVPPDSAQFTQHKNSKFVKLHN